MGEIMKQGAEILEHIGKKYQKSPTQVALNWLISQKNVVTLSKMRNPKHLHENLGATDWQMDQEDIEFLRKDFPGQLSVSPAVPLEEWS